MASSPLWLHTSLTKWSMAAGSSEGGDGSPWFPGLMQITAGLTFYPRRCPEESFRKQASALKGLDWEIQKLLEQEVFNHFLNHSCNYRLCFLLSDNFIDYYGNKIWAQKSFFFFFFKLVISDSVPLESDIDIFNQHFDCCSGSLSLLDSVIIRWLLKTLAVSNTGNKVKYKELFLPSWHLQSTWFEIWTFT